MREQQRNRARKHASHQFRGRRSIFRGASCHDCPTNREPGQEKDGIFTIALAGNPNAGKTTLFNAITGARQRVGNYPGVTVERREGIIHYEGREYRFVDLPGTYSLTAYSIDEVVARDFLLDERPDLIVDVIDSTNLERHLYLCLQFQELGIPVMGALNMSDEAEGKGISIDADALAAILGIPMVKTVGSKEKGVTELMEAISAMVGSCSGCEKTIYYGDELEVYLARIEKEIGKDEGFVMTYPSRWMAVKLLEKDSHARKLLDKHPGKSKIIAEADEAIAWVEKHYGKDAEIIVSEQRYAYIRGAVREVVKVKKVHDFSITEAIDKVVMNRFLALPIFLAVLWVVFQLTFTLGEVPMVWLEESFASLSVFVGNVLPDGWFSSLIADGIIAGVGGVLSFVPLIIILFFFMSLLEDLGYMSRAAFATDKFLHAFGLHGQSIFPIMVGFGCSVPAIMAARTLKNPRDRIVTILIIPFMSCGAKLPVYVLLAKAFFPKNPGAMVMLIYGIGFLIGLVAALIFKKTIARGDATPFVMELPPYRLPTLRGILWHVWEKTWHYAKKAGTIILLASILIWASTAFPVYRPAESGEIATFLDRLGDDELEIELGRLQLENSIAGKLGHFMEPIFRPMGFDWRIGIATITGFAAKEVVVSTLGVLYHTEEEDSLREALANDPGFNPAIALALMLFVLIIPPCLATLATIKAELGWKWLGVSVSFNLALGWVLATIVYKVGMLFIA